MRLMLVANRLKSCQKVEKSSKRSKKPQRSRKTAKVIDLKERLSKYRSSVNKKLKLLLELWQFFELFFVGPRSSLDTTFGAIIVMAKLMELLMRCHVFPQRNQTKPCHTQFLSTQCMSSLRYLSSGMHFKYFVVKMTQELVANVLLLLHQFWRCAPKENVPV